jgi:hypothetical protein
VRGDRKGLHHDAATNQFTEPARAQLFADRDQAAFAHTVKAPAPLVKGWPDLQS